MESQLQKPLLIYDGECAFCAWWVRYWQRLAGDVLDYEPYQSAAERFPEIGREDFRRAIQLLTPAGERYEGAAAAVRVLDLGGKPVTRFCYRFLPGYAWLAERIYGLVSRHRSVAGRAARVLWGRERYPAEYRLVSALFLRVLGLIYLMAFVSFGLQVEGLIGSAGILPLQDELQHMTREYGTDAWWLFPSVFWLNASDMALLFVCVSGALGGLLLALNIRTRLMLPLLFVLYLSLVYAGQVFMSFQWDFLLLEVGFLAIFLPWGSPIILWLLHWVLFRLRFLSGAAKLLSGDESWSGFTALRYYFETQPLPHIGAWYAHHLPDWLLRLGVGGVFFVELVVPFMIFLPRRPRMFAAWATIVMQVLIVLTSNHNFFNLLTIALCLLLFDDRALRGLRMRHALQAPGYRPRRVSPLHTLFAAALAMAIVSSSLSMMWTTFTGRALPAFNEPLVRALVQWHIVNNYHVFPVITTERPELIVEGSNDGVDWRPYVFRYKPGDPAQRPKFVVPHQPRLDWQMWFAALSPPYSRTAYWITDFLRRLLEGSKDVLGLLAGNPFPDAPPRFVRVRIEDYRFTTPQEHRATGRWWVITPRGMYLPPMSLDMMP